MKKMYKAEYDTRLLYRQQYITDEGIYVTSASYAVIWAYSKNVEPTTTRIRLTTMCTKESGEYAPVQGLIEQWKTNGWLIMDEFCDADLSFGTQEGFEGHLMKMARAFILGIPIKSDILSDDDDDPVAPRQVLGKFKGRTFKFKDNNSNDLKGDSDLLKGSKDIPEAEEAVTSNHTPTENENISNEDDEDDDDWI
jgi:hypothetical protein